jgi:hypothetical protein
MNSNKSCPRKFVKSKYIGDEDVVEIVVPSTKAVIICAGSDVLYNTNWRRRMRTKKNSNICTGPEECECEHGLTRTSNCRTPDTSKCACWCHETVIDVTKDRRFPRCFGSDFWQCEDKPKPMEDEIPVSLRDKKKFSRTAVRYAAFLFLQVTRLEAGHLPSPVKTKEGAEQHLILHCRNGRCRSPTVIAIFLLLFYFRPMRKQLGKNKQTIVEYLQGSFQRQRPVAGSCFPNFIRILKPISLTILGGMEHDHERGDAWLEEACVGVWDSFNAWARAMRQTAANTVGGEGGKKGRCESYADVDRAVLISRLNAQRTLLKLSAGGAGGVRAAEGGGAGGGEAPTLSGAEAAQLAEGKALRREWGSLTNLT